MDALCGNFSPPAGGPCTGLYNHLISHSFIAGRPGSQSYGGIKQRQSTGLKACILARTVDDPKSASLARTVEDLSAAISHQVKYMSLLATACDEQTRHVHPFATCHE